MRPINDIKTDIRERLIAAAEAARSRGSLNFETIPAFVVEVPREKEHGDFASNLAMVLAKQARQAPRRIADILLENLVTEGSYIAATEVAGAGFINFRLDSAYLLAAPKLVAQMGERYGSVQDGEGQKIQVEFVSANPTGLLHMGNARGGAIGDSLANLLEFAGYTVEREFYVNDAGNQMRLFGLSLEARYLQLLGRDVPFPEDGYHGEDIRDTAQHYVDAHGDSLLQAAGDDRCATLAAFALEEKLAAIRATLGAYRIHYDVWFSERSLYDSGKLAATLEDLKTKGEAYEKDGALLLRAAESTAGKKDKKAGERENLEEKDDVLVRQNGFPTYFAADIAYHRDKFDRGFDRVINIWGADHHGHVARMKRSVGFFGYDPEDLVIILMQFVRLIENGEPVVMSKRTGKYLTLEDLIEEVGVDAARYFFVMRNPDSVMDFDLALARSQTSDNPVFYVQYAHARICSILRQSLALGFTVPDAQTVDYSPLQTAEELALLQKIAAAAALLEPHRLCAYLQELAATFHVFYNHCRVNCEDAALRDARLGVCLATRTCLKNVLTILGVSAPSEM